jgi:hypothetical protein
VTIILPNHAAGGITDLTLEVCLLPPLDAALPLDHASSPGVWSLGLDSGVNKRPQRRALCSTQLIGPPPLHSIRVPIHITQVPRG